MLNQQQQQLQLQLLGAEPFQIDFFLCEANERWKKSTSFSKKQKVTNYVLKQLQWLPFGFNRWFQWRLSDDPYYIKNCRKAIHLILEFDATLLRLDLSNHSVQRQRRALLSLPPALLHKIKAQKIVSFLFYQKKKENHAIHVLSKTIPHVSQVFHDQIKQDMENKESSRVSHVTRVLFDTIHMWRSIPLSYDQNDANRMTALEGVRKLQFFFKKDNSKRSKGPKSFLVIAEIHDPASGHHNKTYENGGEWLFRLFHRFPKQTFRVFLEESEIVLSQTRPKRNGDLLWVTEFLAAGIDPANTICHFPNIESVEPIDIRYPFPEVAEWSRLGLESKISALVSEYQGPDALLRLVQRYPWNEEWNKLDEKEKTQMRDAFRNFPLTDSSFPRKHPHFLQGSQSMQVSTWWAHVAFAFQDVYTIMRLLNQCKNDQVAIVIVGAAHSKVYDHVMRFLGYDCSKMEESFSSPYFVRLKRRYMVANTRDFIKTLS